MKDVIEKNMGSRVGFEPATFQALTTHYTRNRATLIVIGQHDIVQVMKRPLHALRVGRTLT